MYNEKAKASMMKYKKEKREEVRLNVAKGTVAKYKAFAERKGMSMTAFITSLMEAEMQKDEEFCAMWAAKEREEAARLEAEKVATVAAIRSECKPPKSESPVKPLPYPKPEK